MIARAQEFFMTCREFPANTVETPWISQLIPQTFLSEMSCENRTGLFTKKNLRNFFCEITIEL